MNTPVNSSSESTPPTLDEGSVDVTAVEKKAKKDKKKKKKASKGVETMFRTTLGNHLRLSEMADQKANLMITINTVLISITISSFLRPVVGAEGLVVPEILLLIVSLITVIISIFATKPSFSLRKNVMPRIHPPIDLLFFGDYTQLSAAEYREQLRMLIANEEGLYNSLIDNIYAQGLVLSKKYRLLTVAYNFFMIGFSVVVISSLVMLLARR